MPELETEPSRRKSRKTKGKQTGKVDAKTSSKGGKKKPPKRVDADAPLPTNDAAAGADLEALVAGLAQADAPVGDVAVSEDAERVQAREESGEHAGAGTQMVDSLPMEEDDDLAGVTGEANPKLAAIIESLLFAAQSPMTVRGLRSILKDPTTHQIQLGLKHLQEIRRDTGVVLQQVAGGFRLATHPEHGVYVQQLMAGKPARLTRSQLETLAVIAYRQPATKPELDHIRGVDCGAVLRLLLERDLVKIVGRKEEPGRPQLYGTTVKFLEFFGLRNLRDMPDLHEFRELSDDSVATLQAELGDDADELADLGQERLLLDPQPTDDASFTASDPPEFTVPADPHPDTAADSDADSASDADSDLDSDSP